MSTTPYPAPLDAPRWTPYGGLPWDGPSWECLLPSDPPEPDGTPPPGDLLGPGPASDGAPRVAIQLFVSPDSPACAAARRNIERALAEVERHQVQLEICDVSLDPNRAAEAHVCFTPTLLIRSGDQPPIWIFGALTDAEVLSEHLEVAGLLGAPRGN